MASKGASRSVEAQSFVEADLTNLSTTSGKVLLSFSETPGYQASSDVKLGAYAGDGTIDTSDWNHTAAPITTLTSSDLHSNSSFSIDVTSAYNDAISNGQNHLGLSFTGVGLTGASGDNYALSDFKIVNVTNSAPVLSAATPVLEKSAQGAPYKVSANDLLVGYTDADNDTLSVKDLSADHGTVTTNNDGTYIVTPSATYTGQVKLSYDVTDGTDSVAATQEYKIDAAPVLDATKQAILAKGALNTAYVVKASALLQAYTDAESETLTIKDVKADHGDVVASNDGASFTVTPTSGYTGTEKLTFLLSDGVNKVVGTQSYQVAAPVAAGDDSDSKQTITPGADIISLVSGTGSISGMAGNDRITASGGQHLIYGNQGDDVITGTAGSDTVFGGQGNDKVDFSKSADAALIYGNHGDDVLIGSQGADRMFGGRDNDTASGGLGSDVIYGNLGNDAVYGNLGNDVLFAGQGNDKVFGGQGADLLWGNKGDDTILGGLGADTFSFRTGDGNDVIPDFSAAQGDKIDLQGQGYSFAGDGKGGTMLTLSGGGTIDLAGINAQSVDASWFAHAQHA